LLITTNQVVTQWGTVFGDDVLAANSRPRAPSLPHTHDSRGELSSPSEEEGRLAQSQPWWGRRRMVVLADFCGRSPALPACA